MHRLPHSMVIALGLAVVSCGGGLDGDAPEGDSAQAADATLPERMQTGAAIDGDLSGDLRPEALELILGEHLGAPAGRLTSPLALARLPSSIRVWRRALDGSTASCSGRVDVIAFEKYVKGVLPHEWIASWHAEALKAGAVAARTYGAYWVAAGGKYNCADVDDTTASQVYKDAFVASTNAAVDAVASIVAVKSGAAIFSQYSAENSDPTADGVAEPLCHGRTRQGHGHGMCQWGTQRWATQAGKTFDWMVTHYYPGAVLAGLPAGVAIVIDSNNANNDTTQGYAEISANWTASSATAGYYGTGYYFASTAAVSDPAAFYFYLAEGGSKTIDAWWTQGSNRAPAAPYIIVDSSGTWLATVKVDETTGGSQWNTLGTWSFPAGWNKVLLSRWTTTGAVVIADAVRVR
jgi:hypothetical protein